MEKFEQKINGIFSNLGIPFVDYGLVNSESTLIEGFFRNSELFEIQPNKKQIFRMASMTKPITAYLALNVLDEYKLNPYDKGRQISS